MTDGFEQTKREFLAFREDCVWLVTVFNTHQNLFDRGAKIDKLLRETAGWFFMDFSIVSQEYFTLLVGRLTDPSQKGTHTNLSVNYIVDKLVELGLITDAIRNKSDAIIRYSKYTQRARNKLIAHRDLEAILKPLPPEAWPMIDAQKFVSDVNSFCELAAVQLDIEPIDFRATPAKGDAIDLIKFLKSARNDR